MAENNLSGAGGHSGSDSSPNFDENARPSRYSTSRANMATPFRQPRPIYRSGLLASRGPPEAPTRLFPFSTSGHALPQLPQRTPRLRRWLIHPSQILPARQMCVLSIQTLVSPPELVGTENEAGSLPPEKARRHATRAPQSRPFQRCRVLGPARQSSPEN